MPRIKLTTLDARDGLVPIGPRCALSEGAAMNLGLWSARVEPRARACAAKLVQQQDVEDVIHSALVRLIEACTDFHDPRPFPTTEAAFRNLFLKIVRNLACDYQRFGDDGERSTHKFWGEAEPHLPHRHMPDRSLALDTESLWLDDADIDEEDGGPVLRVPHRGVYDAPPDEPKIHYEEFAEFVDSCLEQLTPMQADIVEYLCFDGRTRAEVAEMFGISPKTVDTHLARAIEHLQSALICWFPRDAYDDNRWRDVIKAMWRAMLLRKWKEIGDRAERGGASEAA